MSLRFCRRLSTATNPFPYPTLRNPTPHQIFHLPRNATEAEIKTRYYDLVRLYHPDKALASSSISPHDAHARFRAITAAYASLRGKTVAPPLETIEHQHQTTAAYRAMQRKRQELYNTGAADDSALDKWLVVGVVATIFFVLIHNLSTRREAIAARAREIALDGKSRRIRDGERRLE